MPLTLEPNAVVAGKYRLDALLGKGGMGEVWSAEQATTKKRVAMKFLVGDSANNEDTRRRFVREARAACAVSHPNVVQIHDVIEADDATPVLVMELLKGESLEAKLKRDGKLGVEETISILLRVVSAVGTAHTQGVVHRDLKPDNIFLSETPDGVDVKVLDFGIAKVGPSEDGSQTGALTSTGTMLGTPFYMSPEQAFGEKKIDHRADIWSLGIVMFRCLSGQLPTRADNLGQILKIIMTRAIPKLSEVAPHVPPELAALVDKMLAYSAADRPADLREVKASLEQILSVGVADFGPPAIDASTMGGVAMIPAVPGTTTSASSPPKRASSGAIALGGAAVLVALTAGVVLWKKSSSQAAVATSQATTSTAVATESATVTPTTTAETTPSPPSAGTTATPHSAPSSAAASTPKPPPNKPQPSTTTPTTTTQTPAPSATTKGPGIIETPPF